MGAVGIQWGSSVLTCRKSWRSTVPRDQNRKNQDSRNSFACVFAPTMTQSAVRLSAGNNAETDRTNFQPPPSCSSGRQEDVLRSSCRKPTKSQSSAKRSPQPVPFSHFVAQQQIRTCRDSRKLIPRRCERGKLLRRHPPHHFAFAQARSPSLQQQRTRRLQVGAKRSDCDKQCCRSC